MKISNKIKMLVLIFGSIFISSSIFAINTWYEGYKLPDTNSYKELTFSKSGSTTDKMQVYNNSGSTLFAPTKTNSEFSSFLVNAPGVWGYKYYKTYTTTCGHNCSDWLVNNRNDHMDWTFYIPTSGPYRFYFNIQRQYWQSSEDFKIYIDLNGDGDFSDSGEYLATFRDTGTDDDLIQNWKWKWALDSNGNRVYRNLQKGNYKFRMQAANNTGNNVGIGKVKFYTY